MEPGSQRRARLFEDRPGQWVDVIPARLTSISRAPMDAIVLAGFVALLTLSYAAGEALFFDLLKAGIVRRKVLVELLKGVAEFNGNALARFHGKNSMPFVLLVVKGYLPPLPPI